MTEKVPHVLHVTQPLDGGVGRVVAGLVRAQRAGGWQVTLASPPGPGLPEEAAAAGADLRTWPATREPGPSVLTECRRLSTVVSSTRPDIIHLHSAKAGLVGRLVLRGRCPTVYSPHGWSFHAARGPLRRAVLAWERLAARRWTDRLVCVSADEQDTGERAGIRARWAVIENAVDTIAFRQLPGGRALARQSLGIALDTPLAVCVGRLSEAKGQDLLLDQWSVVRARVPGAELVLVGDGPLRDRLAGRAQPGVLLVGPANPVDWYAAADVVVVPSRWEGMALAPLEAMASARSVVAFEVDGLPPLLRRQGAVVPRGRMPTLAAAVADRLEDGERRRAEELANEAEACSHYDLARSTRETMSLYEDVLGGRRAGAH